MEKSAVERSNKLKVLIAGVGGASLGTELMKCLHMSGRYEIYGCDISSIAYGLYEPQFFKTIIVDKNNYLESVINYCVEMGITWVVPGGEQPMVLLAGGSVQLANAGIGLVANNPELIRVFSDKAKTFEWLSKSGIAVPRTKVVLSAEDVEKIGFPCIVKPSTGTGGSAMVFYATDSDEAMTYVNYIKKNSGTPVVQEYISETEGGEFTVGVLSEANGKAACSIALRRSFESKLSVQMKARGGLISSGYSQGYIGRFKEIEKQAMKIADSIESKGAINIQGRVRDGILIPFEINPRLSASTYLRAMAGVNEIDLLLQNLAFQRRIFQQDIREGWYLRSLTETYVAPEKVKT